MYKYAYNSSPGRNESGCAPVESEHVDLLYKLNKRGWVQGWALHAIVLLQGLCARINHPFILPPPACIARTIAVLLHVYCAIYDTPPTPLVYAIHNSILAMAISCKGQVEGALCA